MKKQGTKIAVIIGAGPAGLTAAYEFLKHTQIKPVILEMTKDIGGISKTVNYKGNRIDIGGHRFFSKSDKVMDWWQEIMPIEKSNKPLKITYQNKTKLIVPKNKAKTDDVFLIRNRVSRIFFLGKLFNYPLKVNLETFKKMGFLLSIKIGFSYFFALIFPIKKENTLQDLFINRFGKKLYQIFFKDYTEKVWGVSCSEIPAEWGRQRIKKLNILKTIKHSIAKINNEIDSDTTETSLIEKFLYPKHGPGQLWEKVAMIVKDNGGEIHHNCKVISINHSDFKVNSVEAKIKNNTVSTFKADYIISTMPVKYLIRGLGNTVPKKIQNIANGLIYRDFIIVGLLVQKINLNNGKINDNWIYIQDQNVKLGRIQIFNNWSPYMVKDPSKIWLGLEYFCNQGDSLWEMTNDSFIDFAINELVSIGIIDKNNVLDHVIIKMPKTYPAYFGTYDQFDRIIEFTNKFHNLFLIGRNGMHKYNNQDHSMLAAIITVQNIKNNRVDKSNIWNVNTEEKYHEVKNEG